MKNKIRWIVTLTAAIIMCSCASDVDKLEKAVDYYESNGYLVNTSYYGEGHDKLYILAKKMESIILTQSLKVKVNQLKRFIQMKKEVILKHLKSVLTTVLTV